MRFESLVSLALLSGALAAPTKQHPLVHKSAPYTHEYKDPYDSKLDTYGEEIQPLPIVSEPLMNSNMGYLHVNMRTFETDETCSVAGRARI